MLLLWLRNLLHPLLQMNVFTSLQMSVFTNLHAVLMSHLLDLSLLDQKSHQKTCTALGRKTSLETPTPNRWLGKELLIDKMQMVL
jgi:hypothetical protein